MNLGAIERDKDIRDIDLGSVQTPIPVPTVYRDDITHLPTYFQGQIPACGSHAGAWLKVRQETRESGIPQSLSPQYLWIKIKQIDGYPLELGTTLRDILKVLKNTGVCAYKLLPNDITKSIEDYSSPSQITKEMDENAQPRIIKSYAFVSDRSWEGLCRAIYQNQEIILLLRFDASWFGTDTPPKPLTEPYGHFVVAYGYDEDFIYIKDSADKDFPNKKLSKAWISHVRDAGTALDLPDSLVIELTQKIGLLKQIIVLWQKIKSLMR